MELMTCLMDAAQTGLLAPATNDVVQWHICTFENQQVVQWHPVASPAEDVPTLLLAFVKCCVLSNCMGCCMVFVEAAVQLKLLSAAVTALQSGHSFKAASFMRCYEQPGVLRDCK